MKNLIYFLFLSILFIPACSEKPHSDISKVYSQVPELLQRNEAIQNGKEWEMIQNSFVNYRDKIQNTKNPYDSQLHLIELFMNEARVTGEHGHYYPAALSLADELIGQLNKEKELKSKDFLFRAYSLKASVLLSQHEFSSALNVAKKAKELNAFNAQIHGILVDAYVELGQYDKAIEMADRMVAIRPDMRSYARVSYLREIHGDVDGAINAMQLAVDASFPGFEQSCWTRLTLGNLLAKYGQEDKARIQFKKALTERENYPFAIHAIAQLELKNKNFGEAEKLLNKAITYIPEVSFYEDLAELYRQTERLDLFQKTLNEIHEMLLDDTQHGHNMNLEYAAVYHQFNNDLPSAIKYAETEFGNRPDNIDVNLLLAKLYFEDEQKEKANFHLQKAKITNSKNPELLKLNQMLAMN